MNQLRLVPVVLACVSLLALSACGGEDSTSSAGSTSSDTTSAAPAASSPAPAAPADPASDKEVCEEAAKASTEMKQAIMKIAMDSGNDPSADDAKKVMTELAQKMSAAAATGSPDSPVVTALTAFNAEVTKAASAADPATAIDNEAIEKASKDLGTACEKAGVKATF
ncbi:MULTISPECIES: hypothetical protein [Micromonospora]|uniref:hypothetical protein n=1 Tax=Micromonospora TaxID=1873 RepID=UPI0015865D2D|nr:hypothetical protein [Micromonospora yangpuensis]